MITDNRDIVRWLIELSKNLDEATQMMARAENDAVHKKIAYEKAYAKAFLNGEGAMDARKQQALLDTETQRLDLYLAESHLRAVVERIRTIRVRIEVGRSLNAAQRAELSAAGLTQP